MKKEKIEAIFERLAKANPNPKGELQSVNPYTLLVAVVLSAQATDKGVNKATEKLFMVADTPKKMAALGEAGLIPYIKTIGLYRGKAKNVVALSKTLVEKYGGEVPRDREALEELPGVGRKTANVVLNIALSRGGLCSSQTRMNSSKHSLNCACSQISLSRRASTRLS